MNATERQRLEDVGYMTCMTLTLLGNYAQTGHFGGPLAYTPFNVAAHLAGPERGGLRYDYRRPKHPYGDKFMLAAGHCAPTCYALWMILGEALYRKHKATGDRRYHVAPDVAMLPVDALGFRRGAGALKTLLSDQKLEDDPLFAQARGAASARSPATSRAPTSPTTSTAGPRASASRRRPARPRSGTSSGAPMGTPKIIALRGRVRDDRGARAGAEDAGDRAPGRQAAPDLPVRQQRRHRRFTARWRRARQVHGLPPDRPVDVVRVERVHAPGRPRLRPDRDVLKAMEEWDPADRRPMIVIGTTTKGYWPGAVNGKIPGGGDQVVGYPSHPYGMKMNSEYFVALAATFETHYGVEFAGIRKGAVTDPRERLVQFKTNIDVVMSVLERNGLGDWIADRLVATGDTVKDRSRSASTRRSTRSWTTACASPTSPRSRRRSR
jgi:hypothetical protein